ncbi:MAG: hypothetical protein ABI885_25030 [Gammaproteobacteria bacterium]
MASRTVSKLIGLAAALFLPVALLADAPSTNDRWLARVFCDATLAAMLTDREVLASGEYAARVDLVCPVRP